MKKVLTFLVLVIMFQGSFAQKKAKVLLTIGTEQVRTDEFLRIYNKNSSITIEDKKSVEDYLDLFIDYKLKVVEAKNLGYDTVSNFVKEMNGYAKQLASPYMGNSDAIDFFVKEAYEHSLAEVNASHILLQINRDALPKDTLKVYNRIMEIREKLVSGEDWDSVIIAYSPKGDPSKQIGGDLGWFTVFRMVYPFEAAAYNTPVGEISMPVRTQYGYHLVRVNDRRENRGEVMLKHIMVVVPRNPNDLDEQAAKDKIEKAYAALEAGADWDSIVVEYSEHKNSVKSGGNVGWQKSGSGIPDELLEAAFALDSGTFSKPVRTQYGYHIVAPEGFRPMPSFEEVEEEFTKKIKNTSDIAKITESQKYERIKKEYGFGFYEDKMQAVYDVFDSTIYTGEWNPDSALHLTETLFYIGDSTYSQYEAALEAGKRRIAYRGISKEMSIRKRVMTFVESKLDEYKIAQLPQEEPDYKYLIEEYHDGILLFNLTEDKVWKKAVEDSAGLEEFYNSLPEKYQWEERIAISKYTYADSANTDSLIYAAKNRLTDSLDISDIAMDLCGNANCIHLKEIKYEQGDNAVADGMTWEKGSYVVTNDKDKFVLYYVDDILAPQTKELTDARGLYTADYQSHLEKLWVQELRGKYDIVINEKVFNKLKKQEEVN